MQTKWSFIFSGLLAALSPALSFADLKDLINQSSQDKTTVSVITSVTSQSGAPDNGYGLLTMPRSDYAQSVGLIDPSPLENANFSIVQDESSMILPTTDFDGANVLYHLKRARDFYANLAQKSGFPDSALNHKIVVRLRVSHQYNLLRHFADLADYNNSRYIPSITPANEALDRKLFPNIEPWNQEIWFDQRKAVDTIDLYNLFTSIGMAAASQDWIGLGATPLQVLEKFNGGIDGEKIPDVIYHEAFHFSTDDEGLFPMASEGNPVAEDYANYFGSSLNGRPQIAEISEFSGRDYKRNYKKIVDVKNSVPEPYNANPFGAAMFWQIRKWLGQERADQLIWNSLHWLNGSFLHLDVPKAVSAAAHADTELTADEITRIDDLLEQHRMSYENLELKYNPGEANLLDEQALQENALIEGDKLQSAANDLQSQGFEISDETAKDVKALTGQLVAQAKKPGLKMKVISVLNRLARGIKIAGEDTGKAVGFVGNAAFALSEVPMDFATDLTTGAVFNKALLTEGDRAKPTELVGAGGAVAATYYTFVGLDLLDTTATGIASSSAYAISILNSVVCAHAIPQGTRQIDRYCAENDKVTVKIDGNSAKAGAYLGEKIHLGALKIVDFFKKLSGHK